MASSGPVPISVDAALAEVRFLADRKPTTTQHESDGTFKRLSAYREGGVFVGHWAGASEWERHPAGDEIVMVVEGATTMFFLTDEGESAAPIAPGELVVVPQGTWHRFETPEGVKMLSVTPQPTDHSSTRPG